MVQVFQISPATAARHEALFLRVAAMGKQIGAIAVRRPETAVSGAVRALAEAALFDARPFMSSKPRRELPVAAPDYGGLAAQLGDVLARLEAFEARHTMWSADHRCRVWCVHGAPCPVMRLKPEAVSPHQVKKPDGEMGDIAKRLRDKVAQLYDHGFADGLSAVFEKSKAAGAAEAEASEPPLPPAAAPEEPEKLNVLGVGYPRALNFD